MKNYQRFCTAYHLLTTTDPIYTQEEIVSALKLTRYGISVPTLSRYHSFNQTDGVQKLSDLKKRKITAWLQKLEELLISRPFNQYRFVPQHNEYVSEEGESFTLMDPPRSAERIALEDSGVLGYYDGIPAGYIHREFAKAQKSIRILDTYLTSVEDLKVGFKTALQKGCQVNILLVDPKSMSSKLRTKGLSNHNTDVSSRVWDNLKALESLSEFPNFEIRLFDNIPAVNLFSFDDRMICGWFWNKAFAVHGPYQEIENNTRYTLAQYINRHWEHTWAEGIPVRKAKYPSTYIPKSNRITYNCYYLRNKEYESFQLTINSKSNEALIENTPSGSVYRGHVTHLQGYAHVTVETNPVLSRIKYDERIASFLINTGRYNALGTQEVAVAAYTNVSPEGRAFANIMVMVNQNRNAKQDEDISETERVAIEAFLKGTELKISDGNIYTFQELRESVEQRKSLSYLEYLTELKGEYILYVSNVKAGKPVVTRFPMKVHPGGKVEFQGRRKITTGSLDPLNLRNIMMTKTSVHGELNYVYMLQPTDKDDLSHLWGYMIGIGRLDRPKYAGVFLEKKAAAFSRQLPFEDVLLESDTYQKWVAPDALGEMFDKAMKNVI